MIATVESKLRLVMAQNGIKTLKEVQDITGLSKTTVLNLESGKIRKMELNTLLKVCEKIGCHLDQLIEISYIEE